MERKRLGIRDMVYAAVFAALIAVCAWISIPTAPPFTLQTMGVFLAVGLLGGKRGTIAVAVYLLLGAFGLPVFAGFKGGMGALLGATGGYLVGFLFCALAMWLVERPLGRSLPGRAAAMALGLAVCYAFGTVWYALVYARTAGAISLGTAFAWCVAPFLLPDAVKIGLTALIIRRVEKYVG